MLPHAPGVQIQAIPEDAVNDESEDEDKIDKDDRLPQSDKDKRIVPDNEFSDSEDEGEGGRRDQRSYKGQRKRPRLDKSNSDSAASATAAANAKAAAAAAADGVDVKDEKDVKSELNSLTTAMRNSNVKSDSVKAADVADTDENSKPATDAASDAKKEANSVT